MQPGGSSSPSSPSSDYLLNLSAKMMTQQNKMDSEIQSLQDLLRRRRSTAPRRARPVAPARVPPPARATARAAAAGPEEVEPSAELDEFLGGITSGIDDFLGGITSPEAIRKGPAPIGSLFRRGANFGDGGKAGRSMPLVPARRPRRREEVGGLTWIDAVAGELLDVDAVRAPPSAADTFRGRRAGVAVVGGRWGCAAADVARWQLLDDQLTAHRQRSRERVLGCRTLTAFAWRNLKKRVFWATKAAAVALRSGVVAAPLARGRAAALQAVREAVASARLQAAWRSAVCRSAYNPHRRQWRLAREEDRQTAAALRLQARVRGNLSRTAVMICLEVDLGLVKHDLVRRHNPRRVCLAADSNHCSLPPATDTPPASPFTGHDHPAVCPRATGPSSYGQGEDRLRGASGGHTVLARTHGAPLRFAHSCSLCCADDGGGGHDPVSLAFQNHSD